MQSRKITKLGILGGGQLAQMLADNNPYTDLHICVLSEGTDCPANHSAAEVIVGSLSSLKDVTNFVENVDIFTFENEFLNADLYREILALFPKKVVFPDINVLEAVQNKLNQKFIFQKLNLKTAPFLVYDEKLDDLQGWLQSLFTHFPMGCMIKWAQGGYDGKGNFSLKQATLVPNALEFCQKALVKNIRIYAEELIPFQREVAMVYCRSLKQQFITYPLVISEQQDNVCKLVYGPASEFGISQNLEALAIEYGQKIANQFSYIGTFALEFFVTKAGDLIINEMAPRVHNTGHYTLDACQTNQFENHIRCGFGSDLGSPTTFPFFAMLNILGQKVSNETMPAPTPHVEDPFKLYWYHKNGITLHRKLGHLNTVGTSKSDIENKIKKMKAFDQSLWT